MPWIFTAAVLILAALRLHFGVDFTDEAYYVAVPFRFLLGDQPFVDELNLTQSGFLLTYPWVALYVSIKGSSEGLVLFTRYLYLLFMVGSGVFLFWVLQTQRLDRRESALLACILLVFFPHAIPNLCYNAFAFAFLTAVLFLGWRLVHKPRRSHLFLLGVGYALLGLSYLPLTLVSVAMAGLVGWHTRRWMPIIGGAGCVVGAVLLLVSPADVWGAVQYTAYIQKGASGWLKFTSIAHSVIAQTPHKGLVLIIFAGLWCFRNRLSALWFAGISLALIALAIPKTHSMSTLLFVNALGPVAIFLLPWIENQRERRLIPWVWAPSMVAGLLTAQMSTNWSPNAAIGFFPGFLVSVLYLQRLFETGTQRRWSLIPIYVVLIVFCLFQRTVFREDPIRQLTAKVDSGPFAGLYTTPEKQGYLLQLQADLKRFEEDEAKIIFYDFFPAGYLMTSMRPAQKSVWRCFADNSPRCWLFHEQMRGKKNVAVSIDRRFESLQMGYPFDTLKDPTLEEKVVNRYQLKVERPNYRIFTDGGSEDFDS